MMDGYHCQFQIILIINFRFLNRRVIRQILHKKGQLRKRLKIYMYK